MDAMVQRKGAAGSAEVNHAVVIVGGGASGITVAEAP
jgi:ribulose 1,5-bisphosphate synthetase/thiazole synthase